jgi:hypothetical protein
VLPPTPTPTSPPTQREGGGGDANDAHPFSIEEQSPIPEPGEPLLNFQMIRA